MVLSFCALLIFFVPHYCYLTTLRNFCSRRQTMLPEKKPPRTAFFVPHFQFRKCCIYRSFSAQAKRKIQKKRLRKISDCNVLTELWVTVSYLLGVRGQCCVFACPCACMSVQEWEEEWQQMQSFWNCNIYPQDTIKAFTVTNDRLFREDVSYINGGNIASFPLKQHTIVGVCESISRHPNKNKEQQKHKFGFNKGLSFSGMWFE